MSSCKPVPTPLAPHFKLSSHEFPKSEEDKEDMSRVLYSSAIGSLMYAMVCTCPDLAYVVSVMSRYMHSPVGIHLCKLSQLCQPPRQNISLLPRE
uniref:Retrovirus-related Pol polyprotein from transposon TNT 1-94 n=1 Tax=Tanacetum cinerariifolium TaxID=118510 RepID=A0A699UNH2_TANCI|nr:retrovirus-related Pol polyprotein from transposon TNT 1-94 [Tanacetum cinerariifolium]